MSSAKTIALVLVAAVLGAAGGFGGYALYDNRQTQAEALRRPDFVLLDLQGRPQNVAQWDGKVLLLNFWGTWCPPCVREIPLLVELQREFGDRGLQIVGIALDRPADAQAFAEKVGINYPLLYGVQDAMEVSQQYGNDAGTLPFTVVIDRDGIVRHVFRKEVERAELETALTPLLSN